MNASVDNTINIESGNILSKWYKKQLAYFEKNFFGMMMTYMIIQSCVGAIATMFVYITGGNPIYMIISVALAMWVNAMILAQTGLKLILGSFYVSVIVCSLITIAHVI